MRRPAPATPVLHTAAASPPPPTAIDTSFRFFFHRAIFESQHEVVVYSQRPVFDSPIFSPDVHTAIAAPPTSSHSSSHDRGPSHIHHRPCTNRTAAWVFGGSGGFGRIHNHLRVASFENSMSRCDPQYARARNFRIGAGGGFCPSAGEQAGRHSARAPP